jgi:hypothetical protein
MFPATPSAPDQRSFYTDLDQRIRTPEFQIRTAEKLDPEHWLPLTRAQGQCCGSGSGAFFTHESGMGKKSGSGSATLPLGPSQWYR